MKKLFVTLIISLAFVLWMQQAEAVDNPEIRVAVSRGEKHQDMAIKGPYELRDANSQRVIYRSGRLRPTKVSLVNGGIRIGSQEYLYQKLIFVPETDAPVTVGKRQFRGKITVINQDNKTLTFVNHVDLEMYVRGVLYHEISHRWPIEAIKAQAVATRTYALYQMKLNKNKDFDVTNDIYSQVYGGKNSERYRTTLAAKRTAGQVLTYKDEILPAFFHASSAGHTEDASELWNVDIAPLKGRPSHWDKESPYMKWKKNFRLKDIQDKLNANGYELYLIKEIKVKERNRSGRIRTLQITTRDNKTVEISGKDFRNIVGPNDVRSNNYEIVMQGYYMDLIGKGWGHGVGMCQWGALGMAKERYKFDEILEFYYPQSKLVHFKTVKL